MQSQAAPASSPASSSDVYKATTISILNVTLSHGAFDITSLRRLCACSRQLNQQILGHLAARDYLMARQLLQRTLRQASAVSKGKDPSNPQLLDKLNKGVGWLLTDIDIPQQLIKQDTAQLISIPRVPFSTAKQLVAAGVRVTHQQLMTAAHEGLEGFHNWVAAQKQLGIASDITAVTEAVCCLELNLESEAESDVQFDLDVSGMQSLGNQLIVAAGCQEVLLAMGPLIVPIMGLRMPLHKKLTWQYSRTKHC